MNPEGHNRSPMRLLTSYRIQCDSKERGPTFPLEEYSYDGSVVDTYGKFMSFYVRFNGILL